MAELYSGQITDPGLNSLMQHELELSVRLSEPSFSLTGDQLYTTAPVAVRFTSDTGSFEVSLTPSSQMQGDADYILSATWLDNYGHFQNLDVFTFRAFPGGGRIGSTTAPGWLPAHIIAASTEPSPWPVGWAWWNTATDDIKQRVS